MFNNVRRIEVEFPTSSLPVGVARIRPNGAPPYDLITPIPHEIMFKQGLAREAVIGRLKRLTDSEGEDSHAAFGPDDFMPNPVFTEFLHRTIAGHAPEIVDYQNQAKKQRVGWVYVIDGRIGRSVDPVPLRDILGAFTVYGGIIVPNSYRPNDQYALYTLDGPFRLHRVLTGKLMEKLLALNANQSVGH